MTNIIPEGSYSEEAAAFDAILDEKIRTIRSRQGAGEISRASPPSSAPENLRSPSSTTPAADQARAWCPGAREYGMRYSNSIPWIAASEAGASVLEVAIDWAGGEAVVQLEVPRGAQAAPAIAHGGFLAALADHVMGFVAAQQDGRPAATRQMTVTYLAPTPTSKAITIRARADSVADRAVTVSLEGRVDDSGVVTFTAAGDYARVSPSRRHPNRAEIDYDTLEERFDPSQVFSWVAAAIEDVYVPGVISSPVLVAVEITDAEPRHWMFKTTDTALRIEPGQVMDCDVRIVGTVRAWRELIYRRKTADELIAEGSATVEDPDGLLPSFLRSLAT